MCSCACVIFATIDIFITYTFKCSIHCLLLLHVYPTHPSYSALDLSSQLGGADLEPFYTLIEGGREGEFFAELEQFFYYAQMRRYVCVCDVIRRF